MRSSGSIARLTRGKNAGNKPGNPAVSRALLGLVSAAAIAVCAAPQPAQAFVCTGGATGVTGGSTTGRYINGTSANNVACGLNNNANGVPVSWSWQHQHRPWNLEQRLRLRRATPPLEPLTTRPATLAPTPPLETRTTRPAPSAATPPRETRTTPPATSATTPPLGTGTTRPARQPQHRHWNRNDASGTSATTPPRATPTTPPVTLAATPPTATLTMPPAVAASSV